MDSQQTAFSWSDFFPSLHPEGRKFVIALGVAALVFLVLGWGVLLVITLILALFCAYFFRDPARVVPQTPDVLVSPADGRVQAIAMVPPPAELEMGDAPMLRISIFLSVLDVHVNRVPAAGCIEKRVYVPGAFLNAQLDKASDKNERLLLRLRLANGQAVGFVQIAGLIARRIVCHVHEGDEVEAGERFGIIRFGSRMDVYLPAGMAPAVALGQRTLGGETIIAAPGDPADRVTGVSR
ncbi:MAG: phosphatidylserine decarboxylase [Pseudomonadota bacterium]